MSVLGNLEPQGVFRFFEDICQIPHGTYNTKEISDYCENFAKERGLEVLRDEEDNIIIKKPGTAGYEESEPIIIQGHLDMVCDKTADSDHDFEKDPLKLYIEDGYIKAKDTTLGGDDGIAVAMGLALLDSKDIPHPPLEILFTTDEEIGMTGARVADLSLLKGHKLINIDSEEEGILTTGCAGGARVTNSIPVTRGELEGEVVTLKISGLRGGHSGSEIHEQRGNAHKLMGRLLRHLADEISIHLIEINGGEKVNIIAKDCTAKIMINASDLDCLAEIVSKVKAEYRFEFMGEEPALGVEYQAEGVSKESVMDFASTNRVIGYLITVINGVQGFSRKLKGIVESSLSMGVITTSDSWVCVHHLIRSSVESQLEYLKMRVLELATMIGATSKVEGQYPAWQYDPDSELRKVMVESHEKLYGKAPVISTVHAGLECGLFLGKRSDLDCVSMGPNLMDVHSTSEKLDIASTERTWDYLKTILAALK